MEKETIAVIIMMVTGFTYFGIDAMEPTHYCEEREIKAHCMELSSTMKTCYTQPLKTGGKRCDEWKEIPFQIEENPTYSPGKGSYLCSANPKTCEKIV